MGAVLGAGAVLQRPLPRQGCCSTVVGRLLRKRGWVRLTEREPVNMDNHMKIIVAIADDLLLHAERETEASQTTFRGLIEEGLREVLGRKASSKQKPIKPVTFRGRGLQSEFRGKGWNAIRDAIYKTAES